jgi:hypothetical protein
VFALATLCEVVCKAVWLFAKACLPTDIIEPMRDILSFQEAFIRESF